MITAYHGFQLLCLDKFFCKHEKKYENLKLIQIAMVEFICRLIMQLL